MAKPSEEITKTEFRDNYNVVKVLTDKVDIMKQLSTFNPNNQAVAFGVRKHHKLTLEDVMNEIKNVKTEMRDSVQAINDRLDKIEIRLDKHDKLFKSLIDLNNLKH